MKTKKISYGEVKYRDSQAIQKKVFDRLIKFFLSHEAFTGECIQQEDRTIIHAPNVLSDIAEIIKFKVRYDEE